MDGTDLRPYRRSSHEMFKDDGGLCLLVEAHCGAVANHVGPFPECFPGEESRIQGLRMGEDSRCFLQRPEIAYAFLQFFWSLRCGSLPETCELLDPFKFARG